MAPIRTPRPRPDLFSEAAFLISKKNRTSTPSMRPPKPPTKSRYSSCGSTKRSHNERKLARLQSEFRNVEKIGEGNFGTVFKAQSLKDYKYYAIKRTSERYKSESDRQTKLQEARNLARIPPHPNIISFYDFWEEDDFLYIQTELCQESLHQQIERTPGKRLSENLVWDYSVDLLLGIKHLHDNDLLHRDVKPENILIAKNGTLKFADFGLLYDLRKQNSSCLSLGPSLDDPSIDRSDDSDIFEEGDSKYLASETMQGKCTKASDIYSIGITILEIASGKDLPTGGEIYYKLRHNKIEDLHAFEGLSKELRDLIRNMMEEDFTKRPTVDAILRMQKVRNHIRIRQIKTKITSAYNQTNQHILTFLSVIYTFLLIVLRKAFHIRQHVPEGLSPPLSLSDANSDKFDMSTSFDIMDNGYDSEESFYVSKVKPKKLLDIFDQIDDEE